MPTTWARSAARYKENSLVSSSHANGYIIQDSCCGWTHPEIIWKGGEQASRIHTFTQSCTVRHVETKIRWGKLRFIPRRIALLRIIYDTRGNSKTLVLGRLYKTWKSICCIHNGITRFYRICTKREYCCTRGLIDEHVLLFMRCFAIERNFLTCLSCWLEGEFWLIKFPTSAEYNSSGRAP